PTEGVPVVAATRADLPRKPTLNPGNVFQNSAPSYTFANVHAVCHRLETTPFRPSWIRTPGRMQNTYANEAFMDELAAAAGADPVEFRRRHLTDARGAETLKAAAKRAGWTSRPSPKRGPKSAVATGRGVTYVKYENVRTYVACVAEVEVERASGAVRVSRVVVAHDCGQIINPDGVRAQVEGNVIQTVSRTLKEELKWNRAMVTSLDWKSYPILTFPEAPQVDVELISRPQEPPWGAGEPSAAVVPSAISNAIFDAVGARVRTVPFTPERVPVAVGVSAAGTHLASSYAVMAREHGADAVMVAPPNGARNLDAVAEYYQAVAAAARLPVVLQDEPVTTQVTLPPAFLARLVAEVEAAQAVKLEEAPTPPKITRLRELGGRQVPIFGGLGGVYFFEELSRGAVGAMTGFPYPEALRMVHEHFVAGRRDYARSVFYQWLPLIRYESQPGAVPGTSIALRKEILRRRGWIR